MARTHGDQSRTHRVEVVRSGRWWAITVPALNGVFSQTKRLDQVESAAREAIALMLAIDEAAVGELEIAVTHRTDVADLLTHLEETAAIAAEANRAAAATRREVAETLRAEGLPLRDIGVLIGLSHQRVSQLLTG